MTTFTPAQAYTQGGGTAQVNGLVVYQVGVPSATNIQGYKVGTISIDEVNNAAYILTSFSASNGQLVATWEAITAGTAFLETLTGDAGIANPSGGNIKIAGTTNQVVTLASGSQVLLALPITFIAPGSIASTTSISSGTTLTAGTGLTVTSGGAVITGTTNINTTGSSVTSIGTGGTGAVNIGNATGNTSVTGSLTATTTLTATLGAITATNGNLVLGTAGNKIVSTSVASTTTAGANSFGKVTLVAGTAIVSTTAVTASSIIFLTRQGVGSTGAAALGNLSIGTITAGTSFVINAWSATDATALATTDVSSIGWMIVN